jgi:hypothetical protein
VPLHLATRAASILIVVAVALVATVAPADPTAQAQEDPRYFSGTGFRIDNEQIWEYFSKRGRSRTFGMPTSRTFTAMGMPTQFFQRHVLQVAGDGVRILNLLDDELLPYTTMNGSTFPAADPSITSAAPNPTSPRYDTAIVEHLERYTPDEFEGQPVRFLQTFKSTVTMGDAFPNGGGNAALLALLNLELWGQPTSKPARDPNNNEFIYQRFQRGVMHYDSNCKCTQGLLLGDMLKAVITGQNLPTDLAAQAGESRLYLQYQWDVHNGPVRPDDLPGTQMANAFRPSLDSTPAGAVAAARQPTATGNPRSASAVKPTATPQQSSKPSSDKTPTRTPGGPTPVPGDQPEGDPKGIALKLEEGGKDAKRTEEKSYADGRQKWYEVRYERPDRYAVWRSGPQTTYSKAIIAKDVETAGQIFNELKAQNLKMPEAKEKVGPWFELNTETADEYLGDEAAGLSACREIECKNSKDDELYQHHRIAFRLSNMVGVVYTYGLDDPEGNTKQNARRLASIMVSRWQ